MIKNPGTNLVIYKDDGLARFLEGNIDPVVNIPDGTTSVRSGLYSNTSVKQVNFPASITTINGFSNTSALEKVLIDPQANYIIGGTAFGMSNSPYLTIEINAEGCTSLGSNCFKWHSPKVLNLVNCTTFNQDCLQLFGGNDNNKTWKVIIHRADITTTGNIAGYGGSYTLVGPFFWFKNYTKWPGGVGSINKLRFDKLSGNVTTSGTMNQILVINSDTVPIINSLSNIAINALYVKPSLIDQYKVTSPYSTKNIYPAVAEESDLASIDTNTYTKAYVNYDSITDMYDDDAGGKQFFYENGVWVKQVR